jgi:hypothetical protein
MCVDGVLTSVFYRFVILSNHATKIETTPENGEQQNEE